MAAVMLLSMNGQQSS